MARNFLVMIKPSAYLSKFDGSETLCVRIPSVAAHYSYRAADHIVTTLRASGFNESLVTTADGLPASTQKILDVRASNAEEFAVKFGGYYFVGRDGHGSPLGSRSSIEAVSMGREAANEIATRLRRMGLKEVSIMDFDSIENSLENELSRVWGNDSQPTPESITVQQ